MSLGEACFVVPVHPPKFHYLEELVRTHNELFETNVVVVFSSQADANAFRSRSNGARYTECVHRRILSNIITEKKLFGVQQAFASGCEYVACVDAECDFIKAVDLKRVFNEWFNAKTIHASLAWDEDARKINMMPSRHFKGNVDKLAALTHDFRAYFWFNQPPIYERSSFERFVTSIDYNVISKSLVRFDYDFLLYAYHLLLNEGFRIEVPSVNDALLSSRFGFVEDQHLHAPELFEEALRVIKPMWIKEPFVGMPDNVFMRFHKDR